MSFTAIICLCFNCFLCGLLQFDLDSVWTFIYGVPASQPASLFNKKKSDLCPEAATVILAMVRAVLNKVTTLT